MMVGDISPLGWVHSLACLTALAAGAWNLALPKGTAMHRSVGLGYVIAMLILNLSAFGIYKFDINHFVPFHGGPHVFGIFHWFAVAALTFVLIGWYASQRQDRAFWAYVHPIAMLLSYYDLVGGGINEAFVRIAPLHAIMLASLKAAGPGRQPPVIGMTQAWWMAAIVVLIIYFAARVALWRRKTRLAERTMMA